MQTNLSGYDYTSGIWRKVAADSTGHLSATISGQEDNGTVKPLTVTGEGHLEVAIHAPISAFGSVLTDVLLAIEQVDAVYGLQTALMLATTATGGSANATGGVYECTTGTSIGGFGVLQTRKRAVYRAGQGLRTRFSAAFTTGVNSSTQVAGWGQAESGLFFGYLNEQFGIQYVTGGTRAVVTMTVTTASSTNENVTVELNGVNFSVPVTNSANISRTVWELAEGVYTGWSASPNGATVVFVSGSANPITIGNFSLTASTAVANFVETKAGVTATTTVIPQSQWNGDKLDGTGASGVTLIPTNLNVYEIVVQYLGAGAITFNVEVSPSANNSILTRVHNIPLPNTLTVPTLTNPSGPFTMAAYSQGSTTNLRVISASAALFIEGRPHNTGVRSTYARSLAATVSTTLYPFVVLHNPNTYFDKANQGVVYILRLTAALKHTQPGTIQLVRSSVGGQITLGGNATFSQYTPTGMVLFSTTATSVTITTNDQLVFSQDLAETNSFDARWDLDDDISLQPGEYLAVCGIMSSGTANTAAMSITWREVN